MSSDGDIDFSFYASEPSGTPHIAREAAARLFFQPRVEHVVRPHGSVATLWFRGKLYAPAVERASLVSALQSDGIQFRGLVKMDTVISAIRAAQAVKGVSVAFRSVSTLRSEEPARRSSSSSPQVQQGRDMRHSRGWGPQRSTVRPARTKIQRCSPRRNQKTICLQFPQSVLDYVSTPTSSS